MKIMNRSKRCVPNPSRSAQAGSSLLEVLVAILILSFGMLAAAGLTSASLQYVKMTQFQAISTQLATEYGDRMRANRAGFLANQYNRTAAFSGDRGAVDDAAACANPAACTANEMSAIDIARWRNNLRRQLPAGDAYVLRDTTNTWAADIWVMWVDPNLTIGSDTLAVTGAGNGNQCPAAAVTGSPSPAPRCMYYRISQ